jgi:Ca2+-binding RTX toxin-like protein
LTGGINVSLALQGAAQDTGVGNMTLTNFENLTGTNFGDTLTGDGNANVLAGDLGDDTLSGGAGNDSLYGDGRVFMDTQGTGLSGPIALAADAGATGGNDTLEGGLGDDLINGGAGTDTASYEHTGGAVSVDLRFGSASGADGNDTLVSIENVIGSGFDDTINGDGADNVLSGLGGNDFIQGQGGNDTIYGGDGDDTLRGDAAETSLTVSGDDVLYGEAGNDGLRGGLGNDQLYGGSGNDLLRGNGGVDYYDGGIDDGEGFNGIGDRVSFFDARATQGAVADLRTGIISNDGYGNVETMVNIESLGADTAFIDTFYGNDARNFIGGSRGDNLYAFGGDDVFQIGAAPAVVDGGSGIDAINLDSNGGWLTPDSNADGLAESAGAATVGWTVNLAAGTMVDGYGNAGTVTGIENVNGSQLGDSLAGAGGANVLSGFDGDDTLNGRAGNDTLDGGNGVDTANYANATGAVTVDLMAGTATGADGNDTLTSIENVIGSNFGDSIFGDSGPNRLDGGNGNDRLISGGGNDLLYGGNGNDILKGELGDDLIDGGAGIDMAKFYHSDAALGGVTVSLLLQGSAQYVGSLGWDTLVGIENIYGTPFADTITGDDGDNWLSGSEATIAGIGVSTTNNDVIDGRGGNDVLSVGLGNHMLTGGSGLDTVAFSEAGFPEVGLTIDLNLQGGAQATGAGSWTLSGFENVGGGQLDDMLAGDGGANILAGNAGNDILVGGVGDDVLYGDGTIDLNTNRVITTFADVGVTFGWVDGSDTLEGGLGNDMVNGGGGNDTASYEHASGAVTVLLNDSGGGTSSGADGNDTLTSIENVTGSAYNDTLLGNSSANVLTGGAGIDILSAWGGNDTLLAGDGADYLSGGMGDDLIDGGAGYDRAAYNLGATSGVTVDLNIQGTAQNTIGAGMDTLIGIEDLSGTGFSDVLTGNAQNNWIWGGSNGFATTGNDTIDAGAGDDLVEVGAGNQTVSGGAGNDTLSLWAHGGAEISSAGVAFSLGAQGTTQNWRQGTIAATGFENVSGSRYDDALTGDGNANTLLGDAGSDTLVGGAGNDTLYGDGRFVADWGPTSAPWGFSLYADLERDYGSGTGLDGNDLLEGGLGNDTIDGGGGTDTASYAHASGAVTVTLTASGGSSSGADGADILVSIENLTGSAFNDALTGNAGANRLDGGAGNDSIQGGAGDDVLIGGDGADALDGGTGINTADYSGSSAGVSVNLQNGKGTGGAAASDTLTNVQNVVGSSFNDNLVGSSAANMLSGGAGNDTFNGGGGADVLTGGAGSDLFAFKAAADIGTAASHDALMDFEAGGATAATAIDHIDLSAIDAVARTATRDDAFSFIGTGAFTSHAGELRVQVTGDHVANVLGDTNGDGVADFVMEVHYSGTLDASDFAL